MTNRAAIPGLEEAVQDEQLRRVAAFTPATQQVAGVMLLPLTPSKLAVLEAISCPVLSGVEFPEPEDIAVFLWWCSEDYSLCEKAKDKFTRKIASVDYYKAITEIQNWLADQFEDSPPSKSGGTRASYVSWLASIVDIIASEYGWSEEEILEIPFKRLMQYVRAIQLRHDPKAILFNSKSDKVKGDWIEAQMAKRESN